MRHAARGDHRTRCRELPWQQCAGSRGPDEVDYVNAHATSTPVGDVSEARAIVDVFEQRPYVSSTKSMTGHEQGACGSTEVIYTLLMMRDQFVAPNINLDEFDPECEGINLVEIVITMQYPDSDAGRPRSPMPQRH